MIKVTGAGGAAGARPARAPASSSGREFKVDGAAAASSAPAATEIASAAALGALIALQSDGRSGARHRAQAERMLTLLERLRDGLAAGRIGKSDLAALAHAANAKLDDADERLAPLYAEIALRARVELAKLGQ